MSHPWDCDGGSCPDCQREFCAEEQERISREEWEREVLDRLQRVEAIRELKSRSGFGTMDCRTALDKHLWSLELATMHLRTLGLAIAFKPPRVTPCGSPTCPADECPRPHHTGVVCGYCGRHTTDGPWPAQLEPHWVSDLP